MRLPLSCWNCRMNALAPVSVKRFGFPYCSPVVIIRSPRHPVGPSPRGSDRHESRHESEGHDISELPPDVQKLTQKPKTDIISDRDRIATSKSPPSTIRIFIAFWTPAVLVLLPLRIRLRFLRRRNNSRWRSGASTATTEPDESANGPQMPPSQIRRRSWSPFQAVGLLLAIIRSPQPCLPDHRSTRRPARPPVSRGIGGGASGDYGTGGLIVAVGPPKEISRFSATRRASTLDPIWNACPHRAH